MNKTTKALLILSTIIGSAIYGYFQERDTETDGEKTLATAYGTVEFTFPAGWFKNPDEHPYDLQCFSRDETLSTGVFQFDGIDFADDFDPKELLELQVQDMQSKRKNFKIVEEEKTVSGDQKNLTTVVYSGDKGISKNYYCFTYIQFDEAPDIHLVVMQTLHPSNWKKYRSTLKGITQSARIKKMANQNTHSITASGGSE